MLTVGGLDVRFKTKAEVTKLLMELPRPLTIQMEAIVQQPHVPMQQQAPSIPSRGTTAASSQGQISTDAAMYVFDAGPLGFALQETSSGIRILSVQPGSAAFQKGVQTGAAMLTVGGLDVRHKTKAEVTKLLKELPRPLTIQMEAIATVQPPSMLNQPQGMPTAVPTMADIAGHVVPQVVQPVQPMRAVQPVQPSGQPMQPADAAFAHEAALQTMLGMGFESDAVRAALISENGNLERAVQHFVASSGAAMQHVQGQQLALYDESGACSLTLHFDKPNRDAIVGISLGAAERAWDQPARSRGRWAGACCYWARTEQLRGIVRYEDWRRG